MTETLLLGEDHAALLGETLALVEEGPEIAPLPLAAGADNPLMGYLLDKMRFLS